MRRISRSLFALLASASLLLCLGGAVLWVRSYSAADAFLYAKRADSEGTPLADGHVGCFLCDCDSFPKGAAERRNCVVVGCQTVDILHRARHKGRRRWLLRGCHRSGKGSMSRITPGGLIVTAAALAAVGLLPEATHAGSVLMTGSTRQVRATALEESNVQERSAAGLAGDGKFNETVSVHSQDSAFLSDFADSSASQNSDAHFFSDHWTASGSVDVLNAGQNNEASNLFRVTFMATSGIHYNLSYTLNGSNDNAPQSVEAGIIGLLQTETAGSGKFDGDVQRFTFGDSIPGGPQQHLAFTGSGELKPGTYELIVDIDTARVEAGDSATLHAVYNLDISFTSTDTPGPKPVPLPPAVWSGLIVLGAGALNRLRKRTA